jgi:hypothetical protein
MKGDLLLLLGDVHDIIESDRAALMDSLTANGSLETADFPIQALVRKYDRTLKRIDAAIKNLNDQREIVLSGMPARFPCPMCARSFKSGNAVWQHARALHRGGDRAAIDALRPPKEEEERSSGVVPSSGFLADLVQRYLP